MAIAGKVYVIVPADKRLSNSYSIVSGDTSKFCKLTDNIVISSSVMYANFIALLRYLKARIKFIEVLYYLKTNLNN